MSGSEDTSGASDRRRFERLDRNFRLRFSVIGDLPMHEPEGEGELLDLGGGGVRFATREDLAAGAQLLIVLHIPGWRVEGGEWLPTTAKEDVGVLKVIGLVKWVRVSDVGVREVGVQFIGQMR